MGTGNAGEGSRVSLKCRKCKRPTAPDDFTKNTSRGRPIRTVCKMCTAETVKLWQRKNKYPDFIRKIETWPLEKLLNEREWLKMKQIALTAQIQVVRSRR